MSAVSFGLKLNSQSMMTTSSSALGYVFTCSIRGGFEPRVKVLSFRLSKKAGVAPLSTWSTELMTVWARTGW